MGIYRYKNSKIQDSNFQTFNICMNENIINQHNMISGEVSAAIAAALYEYMENKHEAENNKLTIKRISRINSPWNSKNYGLRKPLGS